MPAVSTIMMKSVRSSNSFNAIGGAVLKLSLKISGAAVGGFSAGLLFTWTSPISQRLLNGDGISVPFHITVTEFAFITGIAQIGGLFGSLISGGIADGMGRRSSIVVSAVFGTIGYFMMLWSTNWWLLGCGRLIAGVNAGLNQSVGPMYTNEIADSKIRGILGSLYELLLALGILFSYTYGFYASSVFKYTLVCAICPVIMGLTMLFMPESPYYLLLKGKEEKARQSLRRIRSSSCEVDHEMEETLILVDEAKTNNSLMKNAFSSFEAKKALVISIVLNVLLHSGGIDIYDAFSVHLLSETHIMVDPHMFTIGLGAIEVIGTTLSIITIDIWGRRLVLAIAGGLSSLASFGTAFYFSFPSPTTANIIFFQYLPIVSSCVLFISYSFGIGTVFHVYVRELFPPGIRGAASSVVGACSWVFGSIVTFSYLHLELLVGNSVIFYGQSALTVCATVFILVVAPETKRKSFEQIQKTLKNGFVLRKMSLNA